MNTGSPDASSPVEPSWTDLLTGQLPVRDNEPDQPDQPGGLAHPDEPEPRAEPEPQAEPAAGVRPTAPVAEAPVESTDLEDRIAGVLRRPETLRSVHSPIVDLRTGECVGFEAAVRVAEYTARTPGPWMEAATRAGLAADLEAAMLAASLRARMTMPGNRFLAVRVSAAVLASPAVRAVLAGEDDLSRLLLIPVAAGAVWGAATTDVLAGLRGRGILLGVEASEAGRSELASISAARPNIVSLGGGLVRDVHADPVRQRLISALVGVGDDCGAALLADGVESLDDARCLKDRGVQLAHGWLFGRARPGFSVPTADETAWLALTSAAVDTAPGGHAIPGPRAEASAHPGPDLRSHDITNAVPTGQPPRPQPR